MDLYNKYYVDRNRELLELFKKISDKCNIRSALYPGSFVHITPSFVIPSVIYVDNNKQAKKFFEKSEYKKYIKSHKEYDEESQTEFIFSDYSEKLDLQVESFDLLISQFGGFVSESCSKYLKKGGILLVNDSHGDASMAHLNSDFKLIAVFKTNSRLNEEKLNEYFQTKNATKINKKELLKTMKGLDYSKKAENYLFQKRV